MWGHVRRSTIRGALRLGIVTTAVVTALAAGLGTLLIFRSVAIHQTETFLGHEATVASAIATRAGRFFFGPHGAHTFGPRRLVALTPTGGLAGDVPQALSHLTLSLRALTPGHISYIVRGDDVWALDPVLLSNHDAVGTYAVLVHRSLPSALDPALYVVAFTLLAALVAVLVADAYTRRVAASVERFASLAKRVSEGELTVTVPERPLPHAELDDLRRALSEMVASLRDARERQRSFLFAISHDLRTPLTSIRGFAEAIEDGAVDDPRRAGAVIQREAQRIERLLADLMDLSRLEADGFDVHLGAVALAPLLEHLAETVRIRGRARGLTCTVRVGEDASEVVGDPQRLAQALLNLVDNAIKFARHRVELDAHRADGVVVLEVRDDGPGVAPELLEDLGRRQVTPRPGLDEAIGSGLGLLIVSRLIESMGGRLRVRSPIGTGGGTAVVLELTASARRLASRPGSTLPTST